MQNYRNVWKKLEAEHGEHINLELHDRLYEDGLRVVGDQYLIFKSPSDPLLGRKDFLETKLSMERQAFKKFQDDCARQTERHLNGPSFNPPPPNDAPERLRAGQKRIKALKKELAELKKRIDPSVEPKRPTQPGTLDKDQTQYAQDLLREIQEVSID